MFINIAVFSIMALCLTVSGYKKQNKKIKKIILKGIQNYKKITKLVYIACLNIFTFQIFSSNFVIDTL